MQTVVAINHVNKPILQHSIQNLGVLALSCRIPALSLRVKGIPVQWEVLVRLPVQANETQASTSNELRPFRPARVLLPS
jgi:hypothetical protein